MLTQILTLCASVMLLVQVENPVWTAACLAVFAAQLPIQRAILVWDAASRVQRSRAAAP